MAKSFGHMDIGLTRYALLNDDLGPDLMGNARSWAPDAPAALRVNKDLPDDRRAGVLTHEIVHGVTFEYLGPDYWTEEFTNPFSTGLYLCIRDNKKVWRKIVEGTI